MATILDGKVAALALKEKLKADIESLSFKPKLVIFNFGDQASSSYLKGRLKMAEYLGVEVIVNIVDETTSENDLINKILMYNNDFSINGIMVDRPLPNRYDEFKVLSSIVPSKDVDGYTPSNLGNFFSNKKCFNSATPLAAIKLCEYYNIDLSGKDVLVIGRSLNVGKPLSLLALASNATVTIAHSKTNNIKEKCLSADIIFLALGRRGFLTKDMVSSKTTIIDIGINFDEQGHMCGDASSECYDIVKAYSPVPGGVGVLTNVMLFTNLYQSCINN